MKVPRKTAPLVFLRGDQSSAQAPKASESCAALSMSPVSS
jgi:hypothetical protein